MADDESPKSAMEPAKAEAAKDGRELKCWNCAASLAELPRPITRHMNCPKCFEDLHCCRMCRHFREDVNSRCAEDRAEPPVYKEGANFCDYFRPTSNRYRQGANERQSEARAGLNALFSAGGAEHGESDGESPVEAPEASAARRKLDDLFR